MKLHSIALGVGVAVGFVAGWPWILGAISLACIAES